MKVFIKYQPLYVGVDSKRRKMFMPSIRLLRFADDENSNVIEDLNSTCKKYKWKEINRDYIFKYCSSYFYYKDRIINTPLGKLVENVFIRNKIICKGDFYD